jgi:hypothetical protein
MRTTFLALAGFLLGSAVQAQQCSSSSVSAALATYVTSTNNKGVYSGVAGSLYAVEKLVQGNAVRVDGNKQQMIISYSMPNNTYLYMADRDNDGQVDALAVVPGLTFQRQSLYDDLLSRSRAELDSLVRQPMGDGVATAYDLRTVVLFGEQQDLFSFGLRERQIAREPTRERISEMYVNLAKELVGGAGC